MTVNQALDTSLLDELKEKLNLSRFDNTILFTIPFTLFLASAVATWIPGFVSHLFSVPIEIVYFSLFLVSLSMFSGIVLYITAYFKDDLNGRMEALNPYLLSVYFVIFLSSIYVVNWLNSQLSRFLQPNSHLEQLMLLYNVFGLLFAGSTLVILILINLFWTSIADWCSDNIPHKYQRLVEEKTEPFGLWTTRIWLKTDLRQLRKWYSFILAGETALMSVIAINAVYRLSCGGIAITLNDMILLIIYIGFAISLARVIWPKPCTPTRRV